jgi:hypothetical protein
VHLPRKQLEADGVQRRHARKALDDSLHAEHRSRGLGHGVGA